MNSKLPPQETPSSLLRWFAPKNSNRQSDALLPVTPEFVNPIQLAVPRIEMSPRPVRRRDDAHIKTVFEGKCLSRKDFGWPFSGQPGVL
jgi:hypothetical protein